MNPSEELPAGASKENLVEHPSHPRIHQEVSPDPKEASPRDLEACTLRPEDFGPSQALLD
jgi:hypothetical protein